MDFRETQLESLWTQAGGWDVRARVATATPPTAPVVVLVHGLCVASRYMVPLGRAHSKNARVYAPDLPGFGVSSKPDHVLGCQIAVELAVGRPHRVDRLVLVGPRRSIPQLATPSSRLYGGCATSASSRSRSSASSCATSSTAAHATCSRRTETAFATASRRSYLPCQLRRSSSAASTTRSRRSGGSKEAARLLPRRQVAVPGAGHAVNYNAPHALAALVEQFLAETTIAPA